MNEGTLLVWQKLLLATETVAIVSAVFFLVVLLLLGFIERRRRMKSLGGAEGLAPSRVIRKCMVVAYAFMCISIGFIVLFAVGLGGFHWLGGAFTLATVWICLFTARLRCEHEWNKTNGQYTSLAAKEESLWVLLSESAGNDTVEKNTYTPTKNGKIRGYCGTVKEAVRANRVRYSLGLAIIIVTSFLVTRSFDCMCVAFQPLEVSSSWSRNFAPRLCEKGSVCNVYVTIGDSGTDLIVNFQHVSTHLMKSPASSAHVLYDVVSHNINHNAPIEMYKRSSAASSFRMENIKEEFRYVHWAELSNLTASTTYYLVVVIKSDAGVIVSQEFKVKALPSGEDYSFIAGGDTSTDFRAIEIMAVASSKFPNFAMIGGDIAYDNGVLGCYRRWDTWLRNWQAHMTQPDGHLTPMILAIGNHEIGGFSVYNGKTPFYTAYFPQQKGLQHVDPHSRQLYHAHRIGSKGMAIVLDSDVVNHMGGAQTEWLETTLAAAHKENRTTIYVMYHGTMYNSGTSAYPTPTIDTDGKLYWVPLFDKYNVTVVFENHYHNYKRTKPLRDNKVVSEDEGIVYLGDGAWGVDLNTKEPEVMPWFLEKSIARSHMFHVQVSATKITADATDHKNEVFDSWSKSLL